MYDILVLSVAHDGSSVGKTEEIFRVDKMNNNNSDTRKFYYDIWPLINNLDGILFEIYLNDNLKEYKCGDNIFNIHYTDTPSNCIVPYWLKYQYSEEEIQDIRDDLVPISIKQKYKSEFELLINKLLKQSQIGTILFLCRGQSLDTEIIHGCLSKKTFYCMLQEGHIFSNICYIISNC